MRWVILLVILAVAGYFTLDNYNNYQTALRKKDPAICEKIYIQQLKDPCYSEIGIRLNDETYCMKSVDADQRNRCLGILQSNSTICDMINGEGAKEQCYYAVALKTPDSTLCDKIAESQLNTACRLKTRSREKIGG